MGINQLDERHKTLAEELLKGTPRNKIAEKLGVHRSTLYEWMKDPLWQQYFTKLGEDLDEARSMRLLITMMKMVEVTETYLDHVLEELQSGDRERIQTLPSMDTITTSLKRLAEIERTDAGQPSKITRNEGAAKGEAPAEGTGRRRKVKRLLDTVLASDEETQH